MKSLNFFLIISLNMFIYNSMILCNENELNHLCSNRFPKSFCYTCKDCSIQGKILQCTCKKHDQTYNATSLDITTYDSNIHDIANDDGNLIITPEYEVYI